MQNRFMQTVIGLAFTLCLSAYATAQVTPPPPEPEPQPPVTEAGAYQVEGTLSSAQEVMEPVSSTLTGGEITLDFDAGLTQAVMTLTLEGDAAAAAQAHLHCGRAGTDGPIFVDFLGSPTPPTPGPTQAPEGACDAAQLATGTLTCVLTNASFVADVDCTGVVDRPINNIASLFFAARDGLVYANVHTTTNTAGEIRGQLIEADSPDQTTPPTVPPQ